jgi:hypothetical protein
MGVARQISQHCLRSAEWLLGVDDTLGIAQRLYESGECCAVGECGMVAECLQFYRLLIACVYGEAQNPADPQ